MSENKESLVAESGAVREPAFELVVEPSIGHIYLVVIAAIISLTTTQVIKPFLWKTCKEKADAAIRVFAVLSGALVAYTLSNPFEAIDVWMGACAGAMNAFVIKVFKAKVKKTLGVDETPPPETNGKTDVS